MKAAGSAGLKSLGRKNELHSLFVLTPVQKIPGHPPDQDLLDTVPIARLEGHGERFGVLGNRRLDDFLTDPVPGLDDEVWDRAFARRRLRKYSDVHLLLGRAFVGRKAVVELMKHLRFVQRQISVVGLKNTFPSRR